MSRLRLLATGLVFLFSVGAQAQLFEGTFGFGLAGGITATNQGDMNELQKRANARSAISASSLGNAWEIAGVLQYRYNGSFMAIQLRPSMFFQKETGSNGAGQDFEYSVSGYSIFPVAKFHMLESDTIKFFSQLGIGYGYASGTVDEEAGKVEFGGGDLGYMAGLGAEFCFAKIHCISVEGNYRFLVVDRVTSDSSNGTWASDSITQANGEVEYDNRDLKIDLSGIQGMVGYIFHFE